MIETLYDIFDNYNNLQANDQISSINSYTYWVWKEKITILKSPLDKRELYYKNWLPDNVKKELFDKNTFRAHTMYSADMFYKGKFRDGFFIILSDSTLYLSMNNIPAHLDKDSDNHTQNDPTL